MTCRCVFQVLHSNIVIFEESMDIWLLCFSRETFFIFRYQIIHCQSPDCTLAKVGYSKTDKTFYLRPDSRVDFPEEG